MCRLFAYFGIPICAADLVTHPSHSLIKQSFSARERIGGDGATPGYLNGDGFGLGWYSVRCDDATPCVYRQARPAWNDPNLSSIAEKVFSRCLFAHVRAASVGLDVSEATCHPFQYGRFLFMHNGAVGNFAKLRRFILPSLGAAAFDFAVSHGSSDTALCFAIFLDQFSNHNASHSANAIRTALEAVVASIARATRQVNSTTPSALNFVVTDGESLVASRCTVHPTDDHPKAASLYYATGSKYAFGGGEPGKYVMKHMDRRPTTAIISSEPLTDNREDWVPVPINFCVVFTKSMHVLLSPIRTDPLQAPDDDRLARVLTHLVATKVPDGLGGELPQRKGSDAVVDLNTSDNSNTSISSPITLERLTASAQDSMASFNSHGGSGVNSSISFTEGVVLSSAVLGSLVCSGTDQGDVLVWDMEDKRVRGQLRTGGGRAVLTVVADEGMGILAVGTSVSTIVFYRLEEGNELVRTADVLCDKMGGVLSLAFRGNKLFAGFSDAGLRCVVADVRKLLADGGENVVTRRVAEVGEGIVVDGRERIKHMGFVFALVSCVMGRYLCSGCGDGMLRVWDVETWQCVQTRGDHAGAILAIAAFEQPNGTMLFTGSRDCSVKVWVWDGDVGFICKRTLRKHRGEVMFLALADDKLVSGSADGTVCVWCSYSMRLICKYSDGVLSAGAVSSRYDSLFTACKGMIKIRDIVATDGDVTRRGSKRNLQMTDDSTNGESAHKGGLLVSDEVESIEEGETKEGQNTDLENILTELDLESDESDSLLPGFMNEDLHAPPISGNGGGSDCADSLGSGRDMKGLIDSNFKRKELDHNASGTSGPAPHVLDRRWMLGVLRQFVSYRTVANSPALREQCFEGARYIGRFLEGMGASVKYVNTSKRGESGEIRDDIPSKMSRREAQALATESTSNPVVLARFAAAKANASTITFYGHYDVMPAFDLSMWESNPWEMSVRDGYLYGRGATDNKGPIVAMAFAVKRLLEESTNGLAVNIVLVLQGEGEASNCGFKECIKAHLHWFERTCLILTSNSIWLGENRPCLTYGFRGNVDLLVSVTGGSRNLHSGVDGGAILEPMNDLIAIIGTLVDASGVVRIPGFYDDVRPLSEEERRRLSEVEFDVEEYGRCTGVERFTTEKGADILECRWRRPSVSIASVETSNASGFYSVVPRRASAKLSIRFVPDQEPGRIERAVREHLQHEIGKRRSPNALEVQCVNRGDWWSGDANGVEFQIAAQAVREVWGTEPEMVCEGGSMPLFTFLAGTLQAPVVQVPLGQASDGAHLPNERIRELNLYRGKDVLQRIVAEVAVHAADGRLDASLRPARP